MSGEEDIVSEDATPDPAWRGALGRRLGAAFPPPSRPVHLGGLIAGLSAAGGALLLIALVQV
jgi:hypothetical protein